MHTRAPLDFQPDETLAVSHPQNDPASASGFRWRFVLHFTPQANSFQGFSVKLMAWNFLEGGLSPPDAAGRRTVDAARRAAARRVVAAAAPDVLILNEALHPDPDRDEDYAAVFGFPFGTARRYDGAWGNAILSRWPVENVLERTIHAAGSAQNRGFLALKVVTPEGAAWASTYHPHPHRRPEKRAEDFQEFLALLDGPAVLAGDLNAVLPDDPLDVPEMIRTFERFQPPEKAARSVAAFQKAGQLLMDEVLAPLGWRVAPVPYRPTIPTALIRHPADRGMRLDHVLINPHWRVEEGAVLEHPDADAASDHYPVWVRLRRQ